MQSFWRRTKDSRKRKPFAGNLCPSWKLAAVPHIRSWGAASPITQSCSTNSTATGKPTTSESAQRNFSGRLLRPIRWTSKRYEVNINTSQKNGSKITLNPLHWPVMRLGLLILFCAVPALLANSGNVPLGRAGAPSDGTRPASWILSPGDGGSTASFAYMTGCHSLPPFPEPISP